MDDQQVAETLFAIGGAELMTASLSPDLRRVIAKAFDDRSSQIITLSDEFERSEEKVGRLNNELAQLRQRVADAQEREDAAMGVIANALDLEHLIRTADWGPTQEQWESAARQWLDGYAKLATEGGPWDGCCDRRCCERDGRWCDTCWREILRGGWHQPSPPEEPTTDGR